MKPQELPRPSVCGVRASWFTEPSPERAYLLGLLWADGYLVESVHAVRIEMLSDDLDPLLPLFALSGKWDVSRRTRKGRTRSITRVSTSNKQLYWDLEAAGYKRPKRFPTGLLNSMEELDRALWVRGFFDGDGCIYAPTRQISFAGPIDQDWSYLIDLFTGIDINCGIHTRRWETSVGSYLRFQGVKSCNAFYGYAYGHEPHLGLERKRTKLAGAVH